MKTRNIYIGIVLSLLSASCNKDDVSSTPEFSGEVIEFCRPTISVETKGGPVNELPDNSSFGVLGYCLAQKLPDDEDLNPASGNVDWSTKKNLCRPQVFYKEKVTISGNSCSYDNLREWYEPTDYKYSFFAYYPYDNAFDVTTDNKYLGAPKVRFSMPFNSNEVSTVLDDSQVPDAMVAQEIDVMRNTGTVQLHFLHILTGLNFQVNNYNANEDGTPGQKVTIHSLKLGGTFYKSIQINFDSGYDFPDETFSGTYNIVKDDIEVPALTSKEKIGDKTLLLVSNLKKTTGSSAYLGDLKLTIEYSFGESISHKSQTFTRPDNFLPAGGTIYTAQLNFIGDAFVLNFIVDNDQKWEDGGDSDITFE